MNNTEHGTDPLVPVFDGHNDVLMQLWNLHRQNPEQTFLTGPASGQMDLPRCREAGLAGGLFAAWVPSPRFDAAKSVPDLTIDPQFLLNGTQKQADFSPTPSFDYARDVTIGMMAFLLRIEAQSQGAVKICRSAADIRAAMQQQALAVVMHIEGAEGIDPELYTLDVLYQMGLRTLGPVWSRPNIFGHGVPFKFNTSPDTGPGLTDLGKKLVQACNQKRILVDLSHINEKGFWDVAELSNAPLVASHSNAFSRCAQSRNLTDRQLAAIRETNGFVGLNFATPFLREDGTSNAETGTDDYLRHLDYLVEQLGEDHVGFGSDFDGAPMAPFMQDVRGLPTLINAMRKAGYGEQLIAKIAHENWINVLERTWGH